MTGEDKAYVLLVLWAVFGVAECDRRKKAARRRRWWKLARRHA